MWLYKVVYFNETFKSSLPLINTGPFNPKFHFYCKSKSEFLSILKFSFWTWTRHEKFEIHVVPVDLRVILYETRWNSVIWNPPRVLKRKSC